MGGGQEVGAINHQTPLHRDSLPEARYPLPKVSGKRGSGELT